MNHPYVQRKRVEKAMLYRVVYEYRSVKTAIAFLYVFFLLQAAAPAFAADEDVTDAVDTSEEVQEEVIVEEVVPPDPVADEVTQEANETESTEESLVNLEVTDEPIGEVLAAATSTQDEVVTVDEDEPVVVSSVDTASTTEDISVVSPEEQVAEVASSTPETTSENGGSTSTNTNVQDQESDSTEEIATSTDTVVVENAEDIKDTEQVSDTQVRESAGEPGQSSSPVAEPSIQEQESNEVTTNQNEGVTQTASSTQTIASTTETTLATTSDVVYVQTPLINDDNRNQFSVDECVSVGEGSFYCNKTKTTGSAVSEQIVFAAPDSDGDQEIFFNNGRKLVQITKNLLEDEAPEYDAVSHSIVWHRLIEGRYQIMSYDIAQQIETQLTHTHTNNMEPSREGDVTVYQRWIDDNWEIVLYDGSKETILTQNQTHDIAPDIQGGYVIWHTNDATGERQVAVYEIATGLQSYIADNDGGQVVNPRFVLVYDTKFENGDSITKGFDPETGRLIPLSAQPSEEPINVPDADPTGETRALINTKTSGRGDSLEELILKPAPAPTTIGPTSTQATSTSDVLMHQPVATSSVSQTAPAVDEGLIDLSTTTPPAPENLPLTDYDLIVEPYGATSTQSVDSV